MLRDQRVVVIGFGPYVDGDDVVVYQRVVVDVRFDQPASGGLAWKKRSEDPAESLYRLTLANYEQARAWRQRRPEGASKPIQVSRSTEVLRVVVGDEGIYRITGRDLLEAGVDAGALRSDGIGMLYGGGEELGRSRVVSAGTTLADVDIIVEDGGDGVLDRDDALLFYGESAARWEYNPSRSTYTWRGNSYTTENTYWLVLEDAEHTARAETRSGGPTNAERLRPQSYRERLHEEEERLVLNQFFGINSGYEWYWEDFGGNARNFSVPLEDALEEQSIDVRLRFFGWTSGRHTFDVRWNQQLLGFIAFAEQPARTFDLKGRVRVKDGMNQLGLFHRDARATRLDWYEVEYDRYFVARGGELHFDWLGATVEAGGSGTYRGTAEFALQDFAETPRIFDVSGRLTEIVDFTRDENTGTVVFCDTFNAAGEPPRYVALEDHRLKRPLRIARDAFGDLKSASNGADFIIITHADFATAADRLASWRRRDDRFGAPLATAVVDVQDIYDEFSGGLLDPMAIRSFVNYAVDHWHPAPFFVLLMGDGTYDYKNNSGSSHTNWMPPFQDGISMYDEWYVRVDGVDVLPDLAVGRLPVQSAAEAAAVVDKLIAYDMAPEPGPWQTRVLLVADDLHNPQFAEPETYFILHAEIMVSELPRDLDLTKLYLARFPLEGRTKPKAREEFVKRFNDGALILTYLGHGNPETLAHEQMFVLSRDLERIDNGGRLPFMYTAASQVGVFDDPLRQSIPEALVNRSNGGVVGIISATRVGFHNSNIVLAMEFHRLMYRRGNSDVAVGTALMAAKQNLDVNAAYRLNIQRYSLLGDPTMRLARPRGQVILSVPDTLSALEEILVRGQIVDPQGAPDDAFDGSAWIQAFDSEVLSNLQGLRYRQQGAPLFRCVVPVKDGRFDTVFRVPRDISYGGRNARISAYAWRDEGERAFGSVDGLRVSGTANIADPDVQGPRIVVRFSGKTDFESGDAVGDGAVLMASISDESGINTTAATGHEIALRIGEYWLDITETFFTGEDYRSGMVEYQLPSLDPGDYTLSLKAWDTFNNSSKAVVEVEIMAQARRLLEGVIFHPNPMRDAGHFTYTLCEAATAVEIDVYTLTGKIIDELRGGMALGYNQVRWQPPEGLANNSYLYRVTAELAGGRREAVISVLQVIK